MSYGYPGGASPSYPPSQLPPQGGGYPQSGRYSPQPGYNPSTQTYSPAGGYGGSVPRSYSPQPPTIPLHGAPPPTPGLPSGPGGPGGPGPQSQHMIQPGTITYTTSVGPDGRTVYHPFRAVPASYQTPQGVVSGIQWIPAEATNVIPAGAQPANADFAASWNRGHLSADDKRAIEKWQREEEKRRRHDEKEAAKRVHEWERERKEHEKAMEREERKGQYGMRERRRSTYGASPGPPMAGVIPGAYTPSGYEGERKYGASAGSPDIARGMENMTIGGGYGDRRSGSTGPGYAMPRSRRNSVNASALDDAAAAGSAVGSTYSNRQSVYGAGYTGSAAGAYGQAQPPRPVSRSASPYRAHSPLPPSRSPRPADAVLPGALGAHGASGPGYGVPQTYVPPGAAPAPGAYGHGATPSPYGGTTPSGYGSARPVSPYKAGSPLPGETTYPRGHILEGQPLPRSPISGLPSNFVYGANPTTQAGMPPIIPYQGSNSRPPSRVAGQVMPPGHQGEGAVPTGPPEAFSRQPNRSQPYTPFEPISLQDIDNMVDYMPRMPLVLVPHDVQHQDWIRFMTDITLAWTGKMPVPPGNRLPRPSTAVGDLVELWNNSFFVPRQVEIVLYKGRERRTGPDAGLVDDLPILDDGLELSESSEEESEDSEAEEARYGGYNGARDARRARRAEKKQRRKDKRERRRAREMQRRYQLVVLYAPPATPLRGAPVYAGM